MLTKLAALAAIPTLTLTLTAAAPAGNLGPIGPIGAINGPRQTAACFFAYHCTGITHRRESDAKQLEVVGWWRAKQPIISVPTLRAWRNSRQAWILEGLDRGEATSNVMNYTGFVIPPGHDAVVQWDTKFWGEKYRISGGRYGRVLNVAELDPRPRFLVPWRRPFVWICSARVATTACISH